jgi:F420-dependent methylenetetrahydromethanopterin dehydrogenase
MPEEMGIYRGEVLTIMGALSVIRVTVEYIRRLLEEDDEGEDEQEDS